MSLTVAVVKKDEGVFTVSPAGSIDSDTYTRLEERLTQLIMPSTKVIVLDLQEVSYISSIGVGTIFKAKKQIDGYSETDGRPGNLW